MNTTHKKIFDKKNLTQKEKGNKNIFEKNIQQRKKNQEEEGKKQKQDMFSNLYCPQDQYEDVLRQFKKGDVDIGYQRFENAFPFKVSRRLDNYLNSNREKLSLGGEILQSSLNPIRQLREQVVSCLIEQRNQNIDFLEYESDEDQSEQSIVQQQSTKQNSNGNNTQPQP